MKKDNIIVEFYQSQFLTDDGKLDKERTLDFSGKAAGICYDKEGFRHLINEDPKKTQNRIKRTLDTGHDSVYDHSFITLNIENIPKMLAMVLNNEHQYTTSEKSARYTPVEKSDEITETEANLYNKWLDILKIKIKEKYGDKFDDSRIEKLAQENARYFVTVFMPTKMLYTTSFRQLNYIASWMMDYINITRRDSSDPFEKRLANSMMSFIENIYELKAIDGRLLDNDKNRSLSIFGHDLDKVETYFGDVYSTTYLGSYAEYAQAHRHRTLDYQLERLDEKSYFIPPIIEDDSLLVNEWLNDMEKVKDLSPQGELVRISEVGKYSDFILKAKERLCTYAQLEIMQQTKKTLEQYKKALKEKKHPLYQDIRGYDRGARCTFPDYSCTSECGFSEGIKLVRKI